MKPSTVLRITSLVTLIFAAGHSLGGMESWSPMGETEVLKAMKSFRFDAEGMTRTYFDFYLGFGLILSVCLFLQAVLLWQLAALAKTEALRLRPLLVSFFLASVVSAGLSCGRSVKESNRGSGSIALWRPAFPGSFREQSEVKTAAGYAGR